MPIAFDHSPSGTFSTVKDVLDYDKEKFGFDLEEICARLGLDAYSRIRLINKIRKDKVAAIDARAFVASEEFFKLDAYLIPTLVDDPLLQYEFDDTWSDDDEDVRQQPAPTELEAAQRRVKALENALEKTNQDFRDFRAFVGDRLTENIGEVGSGKDEPLEKDVIPRDDDTHYFSSYAENDIHATMIQDKVRTSSYASFILTSPTLFTDAIVLDVGCGTGILSLFAARAGAKKVIAVDASDIAEKAEKIVKENGMEGVVTVVRGKVEDVVLPDGIEKVDVIISEWMGYALLYESMLDSVLNARDRFLKPGGVMAPSQCRMMLALCDGTEILKDRVGFWSDVYGFDLSIMGEKLYDEAIVDIVGPDSIVSAPVSIKNLDLGTITTRQLDFIAPFTLICTSQRLIKCHALVLYFDTFFSTSSEPISTTENDVKVIKEGEVVLAEMWHVGGGRRTTPVRRKSSHQEKEAESVAGDGASRSPNITSFSTGPKSIPTHWKQTIFLLRDPIEAQAGNVVKGTFHCRKSETNSRELDVEIHYSVGKNASEVSSETIVQMFQVK